MMPFLLNVQIDGDWGTRGLRHVQCWGCVLSTWGQELDGHCVFDFPVECGGRLPAELQPPPQPPAINSVPHSERLWTGTQGGVTLEFFLCLMVYLFLCI